MKKLLILIFALTLGYPGLFAQGEEEVLLTFQHPAVGMVYIPAIYNAQNEGVFLPVTELFNLLEINYSAESGNFTVKGNFLSPASPYSLNFASMQASLGGQEFQLSPEQFRIGQMDFFLSPEVFESIFGLSFTVSISHLVVTLQTSHTLPIEERLARERNRSRNEAAGEKPDYPLGIGLKRSLLSGAMFDYNVTGTFTPEAAGVSYGLSGGMMLFGGDLQGTVNGTFDSYGNQVMDVNNLRWRYGFVNNSFISSIMAGQISTTGILPMYITGVGVSNDPIEPRKMYESYIIDGNTEPESEVEIYVNEQLFGYQRADELGYYRFTLPVTYGTSRISMKIYTPSGAVRTVNRQMQVPFNFLPKGVVSYNVQAGTAQFSKNDSLDFTYVSHADAGVGVTRWLTATLGAQYTGNEIGTGDIFYYGSLSSRIAKQYLFNLDVAPRAFYCLAGSVVYSSNLSMGFVYSRFDGPGQFNARGARDAVTANAYFPFRLGAVTGGFRLEGEHAQLSGGSFNTYNADLNAMLGKVNVRLNYRENMFTDAESVYFGNGLFTTSLTYTISRSPGVPVFVKGMFVRGQAVYDVRNNRMMSGEVQLSKTIMKTGRINVRVNYNVPNNTVYAEAGLTLDLAPLRSTTTVASAGGNYAARQSLYGSIGVDARNHRLDPSNRQQVGHAAAAVLLFVDNNNDGKYNSGDELLPYKGISLDQSAQMKVGRDSILRITQLESYFKYNLEVRRDAIADPTLVPQKDKFSFIADPNQYKRIEIPFYRGGIMEGAVLIRRDGKEVGQGGLRITIKGMNVEYEETIRSFNDGGFYLMDLPPGTYSATVDPSQLGFLKVNQSEPVTFEIKALAEGDYIEGVNILLEPGL